MRALGLWEKTTVPGGNPCVHSESMQTSKKKVARLIQGSNPGYSCYEATALGHRATPDVSLINTPQETMVRKKP